MRLPKNHQGLGYIRWHQSKGGTASAAELLRPQKDFWLAPIRPDLYHRHAIYNIISYFVTLFRNSIVHR